MTTDTKNMTSKTLTEFLINHKAGDKGATHTRICDKNLNIYGGSYHVDNEEMETFYKLYYDNVFVQKKKEYLTELQIDEGPILVDFDFRYNIDEIKTRQHTVSHIQDMIHLYLEELKNIYVFKHDVPFDIYIMEKPDVNICTKKNVTKDGIHMIIGIKSDHIAQMILRDKIVKKLPECWGDLPLISETNSQNELEDDLKWENVLDKTISSGNTGWQLYGSQKTGHEAYKLTQYITVNIDESCEEFEYEIHKVSDFKLKQNLNKLSARYAEHPKFDLNPNILEEYNKVKTDLSTPKKKRSTSKNKKLNLETNSVTDEEPSGISCQEELDDAINKMFSNLSVNEYYLKEVHEYTQILPEKYYQPGSHYLNRLVAFALKHTDNRLFLSWVKLRSKASDFEYSTIPDLYHKWNSHFNHRPDGVTKRSILYWAKQDAFEEYEKVKKSTVDYYVEESLISGSDYDFAMVLYQMFKDKYVCASIVNKKWYVFKNHRWEEDKGETLRLAISRDMYEVYHDKMSQYISEFQSSQNGQLLSSNGTPVTDVEEETIVDYKNNLTRKTKKIAELSNTKLKFTTGKNNIIREAMPIFYDAAFIKSMDSNKYLMCFTNGIIDFKNKIFRHGYPQDYITKCTGIPYVPLDNLSDEQNLIKEEILDFMEKLFPVQELNRYMWDHLASTLIGVKKEQVFNIYCGSGSNGKSILTELMEKTLGQGEYYGVVPITLVTEKRGTIGGVSPELLQLKGIRYAAMQEPSKEVVINEGIMKELTGGDPIQARALFCDSEIFEPQFSLVVCTNNLPEFRSNDDGTWRRVKKVDFMSKFYAEGEEFTDDTKYLFPKDKNLKNKLPLWSVVFGSMLVARAFATEGEVIDCSLVAEASRHYRQAQDVITGFINDNLVRSDDPANPGIRQTDLSIVFKEWFQSIYGNRKQPKITEVIDAVIKKFGPKQGGNKWKNIMFKTDTEDDVEVEF
jgi:P4 family phage/plasmid primase-like protien